MGKLSKEEAARYSGAKWALEWCEKNGVESCRKELEYRGLLGCPLKVAKSDLDNFSERCKKNTIATMLLMTCAVLHDEYGFGFDRMNRFIRRFNTKTACIAEEYVYWKDIQQSIREETGMLIPLPDEFMEMGVE